MKQVQMNTFTATAPGMAIKITPAQVRRKSGTRNKSFRANVIPSGSEESHAGRWLALSN